VLGVNATTGFSSKNLTVMGDVLVLESIVVGEERPVARNPFLLGRGVSMKRKSRVAFERKEDMFRGEKM